MSKNPFADAASRAAGSGFSSDDIELIRSNLALLAGHPWTGATPSSGEPAPNDELSAAIRRYHVHYGLDSIGVSGALSSVVARHGAETYRCAVHLFHSASRKDSHEECVILLHGYLDHLGVNANVIAELVDAGFTVCACDLPGHGLSEGPRGSIGEFAVYGELLRALSAGIRNGHIPGVSTNAELHLCGHSTGAAAALEYLLAGGHELSRLVFVAPLIRLFAFPIARFGVRLAAPVLDTLPRRMSGSSYNREYLEFVKRHDPLMIAEASLDWAEAYLRWEEERRTIGCLVQDLLIVLPGDDTVVDGEYNAEFLQAAFPHSHVIRYPRSRHHIFTEQENRRPELNRKIAAFLRDGRLPD